MRADRKLTLRGFGRIDFTDLNGDACSLQESSLAEVDALWLGCDEGTHHLGECAARMHLTREHVEMLIPELQHWLETGHVRMEAPDA